MIVFSAAIAMSLIGAAASLLRGQRYVHSEAPVVRETSTEQVGTVRVTGSTGRHVDYRAAGSGER